MDLRNIALKGQRVLLRVDFNVPLDDTFKVTDATRIKAAIPTIQYIIEQGGIPILLSHLGRPQKDKREDGSIKRLAYSLQHTVPVLAELLRRPVHFCGETTGELVQAACDVLNEGELIILENTRFHVGEKTGDSEFAQGLADLADVYVNDAFGTAHRAHASTATVASHFEPANRAFGFLMEKELKNAERLTKDPARPFCAIIGGAKVSDKIGLLDQMIAKVDKLIIGGGMAYTFLKAMGGLIGNSLCEDDQTGIAMGILAKAENKGVEILLPSDSIIADKFDPDAATQVAFSNQIPDGWMGLDIGPSAREQFAEAIASSSSILWNGPMGVFEMEAFATGTLEVAKAVAKATSNGAFSLVGGGDSVSAINQSGLSDQISYISTGGGAMLALLEGRTLPGVEAIKA